MAEGDLFVDGPESYSGVHNLTTRGVGGGGGGGAGGGDIPDKFEKTKKQKKTKKKKTIWLVVTE